MTPRLARAARSRQSAIVIVAIDDESFAQTGLRWPWSRAYFAQIVEQLSKGAPKVIVIDVAFYESAEGDATFAAAIRQAGNVILANSITSISDRAYRLEQLNSPVSVLAASALGTGFANFPLDRDSFVRRILAYQIHNSQL